MQIVFYVRISQIWGRNHNNCIFPNIDHWSTNEQIFIYVTNNIYSIDIDFGKQDIFVFLFF